MTFAKGAALKDPAGLFNSSLDGNVRRAIDIRKGDKIDAAALKDLIGNAVALNLGRRGRSKRAGWCVGQIDNLRPIGNRPQDAILPHFID